MRSEMSRCSRGTTLVMRGKKSAVVLRIYFCRSIQAVSKKEISEKEEMQRKMFLLHKWSILKVKVRTHILTD